MIGLFFAFSSAGFLRITSFADAEQIRLLFFSEFPIAEKADLRYNIFW
jgi:hypothetical protein